MLHTFIEALKLAGAFLLVLMFFYTWWLGVRRRYSKDLGDGGIQTLFGRRKK